MSIYLMHHGIKGQKWGIRRYQDEDGSYKSGAEGRYDSESDGSYNKRASRLEKKAAKLQKKAEYARQHPKKKMDPEKKKKIIKGIAIGTAAVGVTAAAAYLASKGIKKKADSKLASTFQTSLRDLQNNKMFKASKGDDFATIIGKSTAYSDRQSFLRKQFESNKKRINSSTWESLKYLRNR